MILSIDLGSSRFKAAVFDGRSRLGSGSSQISCRYGPGGAARLDAVDVKNALAAAIAPALQGAGVSALEAVAITSQAQTFTIVDSSLRPQEPFHSWLDTCSAEACAALAAEGSLAEFALHASFPRLVPALTLCQLRRLRDRGRTPEANRQVMFLPGYLAALLSGENACDENLAAMSGLYSMREGDWWPAALAACGLEPSQLPRLVPTGSIAARTSDAAADFSLPAGLPIVLAGNDQTAGAFAAAVHERDALLITLGTCQVAYRLSAGPAEAERTAICGPYPGGRWYAMAADVCGGNLINWARSVLAGCETDADFFAAAETAGPGCGGLAFEIGPHGDDNAWRHVSAAHGPGDFARSIVETLVVRMAGRVEELCADPPPGEFLVAGGGSRSTLWTALLCEALGRPLQPTEADPLAGAAAMARAARTG